MIFSKFSNDVFYSNLDVARQCGISCKELYALEIYTLRLLDYELFINEEEFAAFENCIAQSFCNSVQRLPADDAGMEAPNQEKLLEFSNPDSNEAQKGADTHMDCSFDSADDFETSFDISENGANVSKPVSIVLADKAA